MKCNDCLAKDFSVLILSLSSFYADATLGCYTTSDKETITKEFMEFLAKCENTSDLYNMAVRDHD